MIGHRRVVAGSVLGTLTQIAKMRLRFPGSSKSNKYTQRAWTKSQPGSGRSLKEEMMNTTSVRKKHVQIVTSMDAGKHEPKIPPTAYTKPNISVFFTTPLPSLLQRKSSLVESTFIKITMDKLSIVAQTKTKSMVSSPPVTSDQFLCLLRLSSRRRREAMFPIVQRSQLTATDSVPKLFFKILLQPRSWLLGFFLMRETKYYTLRTLTMHSSRSQFSGGCSFTRKALRATPMKYNTKTSCGHQNITPLTSLVDQAACKHSGALVGKAADVCSKVE